MATLHYSEDSMSDSSMTACNTSVGYIHMETDDAVTSKRETFETEDEVDEQGDTLCQDCKETLEDE